VQHPDDWDPKKEAKQLKAEKLFQDKLKLKREIVNKVKKSEKVQKSKIKNVEPKSTTQLKK